MIVDVSTPIEVGDGLGFEAPDGTGGPTVGFSVTGVRTISSNGRSRQAIQTRTSVPAGWLVVRTSEAQLLERARASYAALSSEIRQKKARLDVRLFGGPGTPLKAVFSSDGESVTVRSEVTLSVADKRPLDLASLREHLGRLGETPFVLGNVDVSALSAGLFLPVSEQNHVRQEAVEQLMMRRDWARDATLADRRAVIEAAVTAIDVSQPRRQSTPNCRSSAQVYRIEDGEAAGSAGATEVCFDPFLRHPTPPVARVRALQAKLADQGVTLRLRTPTIVRPEERKSIQKWLDLGLPMLSGHLGLVHELAGQGRDVVADYAVNAFNAHTAAEVFRLGARRIVASVELTTEELVAAGRAVGRTRIRCVRVRPARGDDDRALRPFRGVRSRNENVSRPVRAEAPERRAHRSDGLHVSRRDRLRVSQSTSALETDRRL